MKAKKKWPYCPFCNAKGEPRRVKVEMTPNLVDGESGGVFQSIKPPFYDLECERCGYGEIHFTLVGLMEVES